ncbi:MAG TPA: aminotransferase class III-fold pyridoxal phosphate-dependent enzyme, partial [Bacilli bacterium]
VQMAAQLSHLHHIGGVRTLGMVGAFDLYADKRTNTRYPPAKRMGQQIFQEGLKEGLILRPLGDTLYYWLPLCTTKEQITDIIERTVRVLQRMKW